MGSKADIRSNDGVASPKYQQYSNLQMAQQNMEAAGALKLNRDLDSHLGSTGGLGPAHAI